MRAASEQESRNCTTHRLLADELSPDTVDAAIMNAKHPGLSQVWVSSRADQIRFSSLEEMSKNPPILC